MQALAGLLQGCGLGAAQPGRSSLDSVRVGPLPILWWPALRCPEPEVTRRVGSGTSVNSV